MISYAFSGITLMQIEIFLQCAKYNSFTKAAEVLQISTSMVSKRIASFESTIGIVLFTRKKNRISLNPAGQELYKELLTITTTFMEAVSHVSDSQHAAPTRITFSIFEAANTDRYFIPLISAFEAVDPSFCFKINMKNAEGTLQDLHCGYSDISFMPRFMEDTLISDDCLDYFLIVSSPLYAGLSESNPLAKKETLLLRDFKDTTFILPTPSTGKYYSNWLMHLCQQNGFTPKMEIYTGNGLEAHLYINQNNLLLTDKYYHHFQTSYVVFKEIQDTQSGLLMVWRKNCPEFVKQFIEHARLFFNKLQ